MATLVCGGPSGCKQRTPPAPCGEPALALHRAAWRGEAEAVGALLDAGAAIEQVDANGWSALHWAAIAGRASPARALLDRGADPNAADPHALTPLHWAALTGRGEAIAPLIRRGARVDARSAYGTTPLHEAATPQVVAALLDAGAVLDVGDDRGATPLHVARSSEVARALLDRGADIRKRSDDGATSLEVQVLADLARHGLLFYASRAAERLRSEKSRFKLTVRNVSPCAIDDFTLIVQSPVAWALVGPRKLPRLAPGQRATFSVILTRKPEVGDGVHPIEVTVTARGKTLGRLALEVDTTRGEVPSDRGMIRLGRGSLRPAGSAYTRYLPLLAVPLLVLIYWLVARRRR